MQEIAMQARSTQDISVRPSVRHIHVLSKRYYTSSFP